MKYKFYLPNIRTLVLSLREHEAVKSLSSKTFHRPVLLVSAMGLLFDVSVIWKFKFWNVVLFLWYCMQLTLALLMSNNPVFLKCVLFIYATCFFYKNQKLILLLLSCQCFLCPNLIFKAMLETFLLSHFIALLI